MPHTNSVKTLLPLFLGVLVLLGYSYLSAQAPANPPSNNTVAPINTGNSAQTKTGPLILGSLSTEVLSLSTTSPTMLFYDVTTGERPFWIHNNSNRLYVLADRNKNGSWSGENPWPLEMFASSSPTGDFATFSNEVRADEFCNKNGDCLIVPQPGSGPATADVVRTIRIANPVGNALLSAARSEWSGIINTTFNNHPAQTDPVVIGTRDKCRWQDTETHPTSGNITAKDTQEDALVECANFVCGHHPSTDLGFQMKMSNAYHGGDGGGNRGVYKIDCFY